MTFTLTEECLFCGKKRVVKVLGESSGIGRGPWDKELWETMLMVFFFRKFDHAGEPYQESHKSGWVVTVCRECRPTHSIADLMKKAKEIY